MMCPECGERLFYKAGRRKFCSTRCRDRANFRAWKSRSENREKKLKADREGSHQRYVDRVKKAKGNVKVDRRPRKKGTKK